MATRTIPELTESDKERFWAKVNKDGPIPIHVPDIGPCWVWKASSIRENGHGAFGIGRGVFIASRVSWSIQNGPIPDGFQTLHRCDNPPCVNPLHLFLGNTFDNMRDMVKKRRNRASVCPETYDLHPSRPINPERGEDRHNAKMTDQNVRNLRRDKAAGLSITLAAARYGIATSTVKRICSRRAWKHVA